MPGKSLAWLNEVEIEDLLTGDVELVYKYCGKEVLVNLWETLPSMNIYVSTKPLDQARKRYIKTHFTGTNIKSLCALLGVSERFIYNVVEEQTRRISNRDPHDI